MSPIHESVQQLEPSNLLEPLDLTDRYPGLPASSARSEYKNPLTDSVRPITRAPMPMSRRHRRGWSMHPALILASALACFGAGAAVTRFSAPTPPAVESSQTVATGPSVRAVQPEFKPEQSTPTELPSHAAAVTGSSERTASAATDGELLAGGASETATGGDWIAPVAAAKDA